MTTTKHTCTDTGKALPWGRKAPEGECPRCDELREGAAPVIWNGRYTSRQNAENERAESEFRSRNIAAGLCVCGKPKDHAVVCTYGEW